MADEPTHVEIVEVVGKTGVHGEVYQVLCKILEGKDKGRVIRRNIKGPVKERDVIVLMEAEREAHDIRPR